MKMLELMVTFFVSAILVYIEQIAELLTFRSSFNISDLVLSIQILSILTLIAISGHCWLMRRVKA